MSRSGVTFPLCFQKMAAGTSGLYTAQVRFSTDLGRGRVTLLEIPCHYSPDVGVEGGGVAGGVGRGVQQYPRVGL